MATITRRIGLSLGADICWPICYEEILRRLDLSIRHDGDTLRFETERVTIEPFDLRQSIRYDLIIDRLTHWYSPSREWIKKSILLNDVYVYNNPWTVQSMEKLTSYCAMIRLGMPIPTTWMVPPKEYATLPDLRPTLEQYARYFDFDELGEKVGYPMYMKPYDGGGWVGVSRIDDASGLRAAYEQSGSHVMQLQRAVHPSDLFVRVIGLGPQARIVRYDPSQPLHDRYTMARDFVSDEEASWLIDTTMTINAFFDWDFNSCEVLRDEAGDLFPIDFANPCPDSQVTSLHYHFPWLIKANLRWSLFNAAVARKKPPSLSWAPFFEIAALEIPYREKLRRYAHIARERFSSDRFEEFCDRHLAHLDEVAWEFFGSPATRDAVYQKVKALYPADEVDRFTELFIERIEVWRGAAEKEEPGAGVR